MILDIKDVSWPGWETVQLLGRGSFGGVYEIKRTVLNNEESAALKVISIPQSETEIDELLSEGLDNDSISRTFENQLQYIVNEYSMMRKLTGCSNIVHSDDVKYVAKKEGIGWDIFIKMELLTPLTKALPAEISDETVIRIGKDMCNALAHCDHYNIVHRDIKPQNMFLTDTGVCKLGDFGIAKTMERTMGGTRIGTFKYMAPEVYHGKPYGSRSDIYSLGLVLYWLLNQRRMPFVPLPPAQLLGGMDGDAANRRISGEPFPAPVNGSEELKQIVMKACAFDPNDRFQSAEEMGKALDNIGRTPIVPPISRQASADETVRVTPPAPSAQPAPVPQSAVPEKKKSGKGWLIAIIVLLLAAVIGLTAIIFSRDPDNGDDDSDEVEISKTQENEQTEPSNSDEEVTLPDEEVTLPDVTFPENEVTSPENKTHYMPDVLGWPKLTALAELQDLELDLRIAVEGEYSSDVAAGKVIRTIPAEGKKLTEGQAITLVISLGAEPVETEPTETLPITTQNTLLDCYNGIIAVKSNGTAVLTSTGGGSTSGVRNVKSVAIGFDHIVMLCEDGTVKTSGSRNGAHIDEPKNWTDIIAVDAAAFFTVGLKSDGTVVTAGDANMGQDAVNGWTDIVAIATGSSATVGLRKDGTVVLATNYGFGNLSNWEDIVAIALGDSHVVGLRKDGTVVASSLFNTNGECNVNDWTDIVAISASSCQTVGLRKDGTVVTAGKNTQERLPGDEWTDIVAISAGSSFIAGLRKDGTIVLSSSNLTTKEALNWTDLATES